MWFNPSEPLRTSQIDKQTLGESVLQVFGVVRNLRTSSKNTSAQANTWRECSTSVRWGSTLYRCWVWFDSSEPSRTTPHRKHPLGESVLQVFGVLRPLRTSPNYTSVQANTWRECSTGGRFGSNPPNCFALHSMDKQALAESSLQVFGVVRFLRTSLNFTNRQANTRRECSTGVQCGSTPPNLFEIH